MRELTGLALRLLVVGTSSSTGASCRTQLGDEYDGDVPHPVEKLTAALEQDRERCRLAPGRDPSAVLRLVVA